MMVSLARAEQLSIDFTSAHAKLKLRSERTLTMPKAIAVSQVEQSFTPDLPVKVFIGDLDQPFSISDLLAITRDWRSNNKRRTTLIQKKAARKITSDERRELETLQTLASAKRQLTMPLPIKELEAIESELRKSGRWEGD